MLKKIESFKTQSGATNHFEGLLLNGENVEITNHVHFENNYTNNFVLTLSNDFMKVDLNQTAYIFNKPFLHCFNQCFFLYF